MQNLSHLEAAPSVQFQDPRGPGGSGSIDTTPLLYEQAPREDDGPMERLHRLCGERAREERRFFRELGKRRQVARGRENDGHHQTPRPEPVKKHRHEKFHFKCGRESLILSFFSQANMELAPYARLSQEQIKRPHFNWRKKKMYQTFM